MLLGREAEKLKVSPIYEPKDIKPTLGLMKAIDYHGEVELFGGKTKVTLYDAGHVLGSAMVVFETEGETILFTGDLGNSPSPILRETEVIPKEITYMVIETVYGDRVHEEREERREKIAQIYRTTVERGGTLLVPVFSLERTQDFLFELNDLVEANQVPKVPVFLDSPLAIKATQVFRKHKHLLNEDVQDHLRRGDDVFDFPGLSMAQTVQESKDINTVNPPKVVLAASGMSSGGRVIHHEMQLLSDPNNTILFIGHQGVGTLGRRIQDGDKTVRIFSKDVAVNATVERVSGYSGHRDKEGLAKFVEQHSGSLKKVFTAMGEFSSSTHFAQYIRDYQGINVHVPQEGEVVEL
jgi:metallo-beta-lactamase family protein